MPVSRRIRSGALVTAAVLVGALAAAAPAGAATGTVTQVVGGLNAPRGIGFDRSGAMYVAQAGQVGPAAAGRTVTGQVTKYRGAGGAVVWSTPFESVYDSAEGQPEVLGPAGLSTTIDGQVQVILSESHDGLAKFGVSTTQMGHLFRLNPGTGAATDRADVGDQNYAWTAEHASLWEEFPDANPYAVLVTKGGPGGYRTFVADAGANTIDEVMRDGTTRVVAYIPNETTVPFRDATPTCIAQGPDGALYVATLHLVAAFIGHPGTADVWRVDPNASYPTQPTRWATGLTTATACTFDQAGNFWATEMFARTPAGPPGDVVKIPFTNPASLTHLGGGHLPLPGGIAQGPDGAMYVTTNSANPAPGSGAVARLTS